MQRAAASEASGAQTPASEPPSKRRRIESSSGFSTPSKGSDAETREQNVLQPVRPPQTPSRTEALREGNETEWVLNISLPKHHKQPAVKGHAEEDEEVDDIWSNIPSGRQTFGAFKRKKDQPKTTPANDKDNDLSSASGLSDLEDGDRRRKPAAKAGPGSRQQQRNLYGSPLTMMPNSKERRRQNRGDEKRARKTM